MIKIRKMYRSFFLSINAGFYLALSFPSTLCSYLIEPTHSFASHPCFESIISNLLTEADRDAFCDVGSQFNLIADLIERSIDPLTDSSRFLSELIAAFNSHYGASLTLSDLSKTFRESIIKFPFSPIEQEMVIDTLTLIERNHLALLRSESLVCLAKQHNKKSNVWSWLTATTIAAAAVTLCIFVPAAVPGIISGAVEVGKAALGK